MSNLIDCIVCGAYKQPSEKDETKCQMCYDEQKAIKQVKAIPPIIKKQKRSIYEILRTKLKGKPATWDEIQQLKLDRARAVLKRDIAKANHERKNLRGGLSSIFGSPETTRKKRKHTTSFNGSGISMRSSADGGLRKAVGSNNKDYKDLLG